MCLHPKLHKHNVDVDATLLLALLVLMMSGGLL